MDKKYDFLSIGPISLDYNIDYLDNEVLEIGGAVTYSPAGAQALGYTAGVVTKLMPGDLGRLSKLTVASDDIYCRPSRCSTSIRNKFFTADKERRECFSLSRCDAFEIDDIPSCESKIYHFGGLVYGDIPESMIEVIKLRGKTAVDVQGFLRHADIVSGRMEFKDWQTKKEILPHIDYFKTDAAEAEILTGSNDRISAAKQFVDWGAKEVVLTHNTEVIAFDGNSIYKVPIKARNLSGRSGRGDTTFAAYVCERINSNAQTALLYATACVSLKMENPGPIRCDRASIIKYINEIYGITDIDSFDGKY
jgi:sugar/nucleoside kinase (ribokinase family)